MLLKLVVLYHVKMNIEQAAKVTFPTIEIDFIPR